MVEIETLLHIDWPHPHLQLLRRLNPAAREYREHAQLQTIKRMSIISALFDKMYAKRIRQKS